ncbi:MAG: Hsp20/alpha crystallin family protein [Methanosarcina sp.]|jgi:HSP20 family protein|nr:Hsp20/alpha crystallin family protein [Methanosarcina sp.]
MKLPVRRRDRDVYSWDPFDEIRKMQDYMEQMFNMEQMFRTFPALESRFGTRAFSPLTDVMEEENTVTVTTDLPGIDRENIELNLKDNVLVISAGKGKEEETEKEGYLRKERALMRYYRETSLPDGVTEEGATAQLKNGVLTITLPKTKSVTGKRIQIE